MLRRVFMLLSVLSLLLCVATCLMWARNHWLTDRWDWSFDRTEAKPHEAASWVLISGGGELGVGRSAFVTPRLPPGWPGLHRRLLVYKRYPAGGAKWGSPMPLNVAVMPPDRLVNWRVAGFQFLRYDSNKPLLKNQSVIVVPSWFLVPATAFLPLARFAPALRHVRRRRGGLCLMCGYDLRATSGRCPECGSVPTGANA